jgi:toxin ParE1/3/4
MTKIYKVVWAENAIQDLIAIRAFISQDSEARASSWLLELIDAGDGLSRLSGRGRIVPEFNQENIRELIIDSYRLVYRTTASSVEILTVFEGHRRLKKKDIIK